MTRRIVVGAGAQGRVVLENWRAQHPKDDFVFVDDKIATGTKFLGAEVAGTTADLAALGGEAVLALGHNELRLRVADAHPKITWGIVVHPSAVVMPSVAIGPGTVIFAGAIVNTDTTLGAHVIVNTGSIVEHDCVFEDGSSISPGCRMGGRIRGGRGCFLGAGVTIAPRLSIGAWAIVGAGAVVTKDIPERALAYGVPAKRIRDVTPEDWGRVL